MNYRYSIISQNPLVFSYHENPLIKEKTFPSEDNLKIDESEPKLESVFTIQKKNPKNSSKSTKSPESNLKNSGSEDPMKSGEGSGEVNAQEKHSFEKVLKITHHPRKKRDLKLDQKQQERIDEEQKEKPADDIEDSQDRKRKKHKTTEYFYLLERKALRMMRRYYKESFESYASKYKYKQNLKRLERQLVDEYFREYVEVEFARNKDTMTFIGKEQLVTALETIILCDRYNKNEKVTEGLDFDEIRNLLNKYNSKNLKEFFQNIAHSFLFSHYYRLSSEVDVKSQHHVDREKLGKQMESLFKKSLKPLPDCIKSTVTRDGY